MGAERDNEVCRFYVSGYTTDAEEPGLFAFDLDEGTGKVTPAGTAAGVRSPSFIARAGDVLCAASETPDAGGLAAYRLDGAQVPTVAASLSFPGAAGTCFVLPHPTAPLLYGADYNTGSLCLCPTGEKGKPKGPVTLIQHQGHGLSRAAGDPHAGRQDGPHVHTLSFVGGTGLLAAVDLGLDLIAIYALDEAGAVVDAPEPPVPNRWAGSDSVLEELLGVGEQRCPVRLTRAAGEGKSVEAILPVRPAAIVEVPVGAGPRIVAYHPTLPIAALICELACELILFRLNDGGLAWRPYAQVDLLADGEGRDRANAAGKPPLSAHVAFSSDGRFLYASTRGADQLAVFLLDGDGVIAGRRTCASGGRTPRHFALSPDGAFVAVANQTSGNVALFRRDGADGALTPVADLPCGKPSCILWDEPGER